MVKKTAGLDRPNVPAEEPPKAHLGGDILQSTADTWRRNRRDKADVINTEAGENQIGNACWVWDNLLPKELKVLTLAWEWGKLPYDPVIGARIREALRRAVLGLTPGQSESPGNSGIDR